MPVYEYGCSHCRTIFQFWTQKIGDTRIPKCPKCGNPEMKKMLSTFAIGSGAAKKADLSSGDEGDGGMDPFANMSPEQQAVAEREMMKIMGDIDSLDENDPRQMGSLLRRMKESTGMDFGQEMDEAIRRLESGEDPEKIEEELGPLFDEESMMDGYGGMGGGGWSHDDTLYDL